MTDSQTTRCPPLAYHLAAYCVAIVLLSPWQASGQSPLPAAPAQEELKDMLRSKRVSVDFQETPLDEALRAIAAENAIQIRIDRRSLDLAQIDPASPTTIVLQDVPLEVALSLMLRDAELCITPVDRIVLVQTLEEAESNPMRDIIDVAQFVDRSRPLESAAELLELITQVVAPETWEENGGIGSLSYVRGQLVVYNTYAVARQVEAFLEELDTSLGKDSAESWDELGGIITSPSPRREGKLMGQGGRATPLGNNVPQPGLNGGLF